MSFLYEIAMKSKNDTFLEKLTENIYQSNFVPPNFAMIQLVMINYLRSNNHSMAMDYFKKNLEIRKISVMELLLLKNFVTRKESPDQNNLKLLIELMSKSFSWEFIYNSLFWAHIMNRNYKSAQQVYEKDLKGILDLSILRRVAKQIDNYETKHSDLSVSNSMKSLHNIWGFEPFKNKKNILKKISGILPRVKKVKNERK